MEIPKKINEIVLGLTGKFVLGCCCNEPADYLLRFDPCPESQGSSNDYCISNPPSVYVSNKVKCQDGSQPRTKMIKFSGIPEFTGWCWYNQDPTKYNTERCVDPPPNLERLPCDAIIPLEDYPGSSLVCYEYCNPGDCWPSGDFIVPKFCLCSTPDSDIIVCLDGLERTGCYYSPIPTCMYFGPDSEIYRGPLSGKTILRQDDLYLIKAVNSKQVCCECCSDANCESHVIYNSDDHLRKMPYCWPYNGPDSVLCCCGASWKKTFAWSITDTTTINYSDGLVSINNFYGNGRSIDKFYYNNAQQPECIATAGHWKHVTIDDTLTDSYNGCDDPNLYGDPGSCGGCASVNWCNNDYKGRHSGNLIQNLGKYLSFFSQDIDAGLCSSNNPQAEPLPGRTYYEDLVGSFTQSGDCNRGIYHLSTSFKRHSEYKEDGRPGHGWYSENDDVTIVNFKASSFYRIETVDQGNCPGGCGKAPQKRAEELLP